MHDELAFLDATAQAELVRSGTVSIHELVEAAIARIERLDPVLNAVIHKTFDKARAAVQSGSVGSGPFRGVPFLLKDIVSHSAGDPFHCGMRALRDAGHRALTDSWLTERFRAAGFVLCGRTNTPELAASITCEPLAYGATRNPWSLEHSPGGSSGGAAAAVAAGLVPVAHGNDMGGSIRIPASACGLVGLKPTRARTTLGPDLAELWGPLTHEHVLTRSVRDTAAVLDCIAGPGVGDPYSAAPPTRPFLAEVGADPGRLRVGFLTDRAHPVCADGVVATARLLEELGHHVEASYPRALDERPPAGAFFPAVIAAEVARMARRIGRRIALEELEPPNAILADIGRGVSATAWIADLDAMFAWSRQISTWWTDHDVLVTPVLPEPPFRLGVLDPATIDPMEVIRGTGERVWFTNPFNDTGQPAISLPLHRTDDGLPVGVQLVAAVGREDVLLRVAAQLEQARPWAHRRPPLAT